MAGGTRGKLKEHFEGIHKDFDWVQNHCVQAIALIDGRNPELTEALELLAKESQVLDKLVQGLYSKI